VTTVVEAFPDVLATLSGNDICSHYKDFATPPDSQAAYSGAASRRRKMEEKEKGKQGENPTETVWLQPYANGRRTTLKTYVLLV